MDIYDDKNSNIARHSVTSGQFKHVDIVFWPF